MNLTALCSFRTIRRETTIKTLRIMKLTAIILLAACLQVSANGFSQKVTLSMKNAPLQKVFKEINKQTGFQFFYKDILLKQAGKINIEVKDAAIDVVLKQCFNNLPVTYDIENKTIVVKEINVINNITKEDPPPPPLVKITGIVKDESGAPVAGASVIVKGTKTGTFTNENGYFELKDVNENATLVISATNIESREINISGKTSLEIVVKIRVSPLDELQIVAYGQTTKRLKTGAVSSIKGEAIAIQPVTNPLQALQGRVSGLSITQTSGAIGSNVDIQIRGVNTISSGTQPLIIVDGALVPNTPIVASPFDANSTTGVGSYIWFGTSPFNSINPSDIESIEVLKDADATAIYGSRGTNGVILITTKKAKPGATKFTLDVSSGFNEATYITPRMNLQQYIQHRKDAFAMGNYNPANGVAINPVTVTASNAPDLVTWDQNVATKDWSQYEFGNWAPVFNMQGNLSGGDRYLNYYASAGYFKQHDITQGNPYQERISGHMNVNQLSKNERLKVAFNVNYSIDKLFPSKGNINAAGTTQNMPPNMPLYNTDGTYWWPSASILQNSLINNNPAAIETATQSSITNNFIGSADVSYRIYKGLSLKTQVSYNNQLNKFASTLPSTALNPLIISASRVPESQVSETNFQSFNLEPQLTYNGAISKGKIDALLGTTFFDQKTYATGLYLRGFTSDLLLNSWDAANTVSYKSSSYKYYRFNSVFGRVNYNWENKYIANLTFRRDGSSRFGPKKQWANFGAVGLGWIFSNESFVKNNTSILSYGKLRGSYGTTGNDNIPDYRYTTLFSASNVLYNGTTGIAPTYLSDSSFSWENSKKLDLALELGFFKDRILLNIDWYRTNTSDLLVNIPVPAQTGFSSYLSNFPGLVQNKGWEIELTTVNLNRKSKLSWKTNFNLNLVKNLLVDFPDLEKTTYYGRMEIGHPVPNQNSVLAGIERSFQFLNVDPATGLPVFTDVNKDGTLSANTDYVYQGSTIPRTFGGFGNTLSYKGFDLDIFFQFSQQLTNKWTYGATYPGQLWNPAAEWVGNYWKQPGDVTKYPRLYSGVGSNTSTTLLTSRYVFSSAVSTDLLYIRLKNLSLSYSLPQPVLSKAKLDKVTIYLRGQNLGLWTSEKIYKDPELIWSRSSPLLKTWTAGIQVSL